MRIKYKISMPSIDGRRAPSLSLEEIIPEGDIGTDLVSRELNFWMQHGFTDIENIEVICE